MIPHAAFFLALALLAARWAVLVQMLARAFGAVRDWLFLSL